MASLANVIRAPGSDRQALERPRCIRFGRRGAGHQHADQIRDSLQLGVQYPQRLQAGMPVKNMRSR